MGTQLVGAAMNPAWATLSANARLTLVQMALTARDTATPTLDAGIYWGSRDALVVALHGTIDNTTRQRVKRAIGELIDAGAIIQVGRAHLGHTATYELRVYDRGFTAPVDNHLRSVDNPVHNLRSG